MDTIIKENEQFYMGLVNDGLSKIITIVILSLHIGKHITVIK